MKVPFSWLKEFVDIDITPQQLQDKLFSCGFEVEELIDLSAGISKVVTGKLVHIEKQEGTDHLNLCRVDCGDEYGHDLAITTGAPNIFEGAIVPVALDGATLPGGITIKKRKMHGVESNGMMCSGQELGINDDFYPGADVYGLLILPEDTPLGQDICETVGLNDWVFDIAVTANRPDCQSILGMAREVAAILGKPVKMPATDYTVTGEPDESISVQVEAPDLCPRYLAHYVRNLRTGESPRWMKKHLALMGLRSISNVVDITNHVLLEIGQPMHAFDLTTVAGRSIVVRRAQEGETITTLDEKEFKLNPNNLVICDSEKPVALAGIMGGLNSEITEGTSELLFECATFARDSVRKTSRALGQNSDSSARYEKGVDQYSTELGMNRALHLIQELGCGDITPTCFDCAASEDRAEKVIRTTASRINSVLGITVPTETIVEILTRLDFGVTRDGDELTVLVPRYREDVDGFADLAEEVIREYGYDHIVPTFLKSAAVTSGGLNRSQRQQLKLKRVMAAQGFYEAETLAFYADADLDMLHIAADAPERKVIRILNPISSHLTIMRPLLAPSLLNVVVDNLRKGNAEGRLFEMSNIYIPKQLPVTELPEERLHLGFAAWGCEEDFFAVKGAVESFGAAFGVELTVERATDVAWLHPGIAAYILCKGERVGVFGKLANDVASELKLPKDSRANLNIYLGEIDWVAFHALVPAAIHYQPIPEFAPVQRDLALVATESMECGTLVTEMQRACKQLTKVELFDIYRGEKLGADKKSMAFSLSFQPADKPLTPDEIDRFVKKILGNLKFKLGIEIRE